jgi:curved DNA-binding protein
MKDMEYEIDLSLHEAYTGTKRTLQFEDGRKIEASIPPGVKTGSKVRLGGQAGGADLFLKVNILPDPVFKRKGDDLYMDVPVDIYTAILGGEVGINTMTKTVRLNIPEGSDSGKRFRLKGLGMPNLKDPTKFGNLYVTIQVTVPKNLTSAEKDRFREIRNMRVAR